MIRELRSYVGTYLKEEILAESLTRNLPAFSNFLEVIAGASGQEINHNAMASDCAIPVSSFKNYLSILEDTLIGFSLPSFRKTQIRKPIARSKHYLFGLGVTKQISNTSEIQPRSDDFGKAFEHFIVLEVRAWNSYSDTHNKLTFWRSTTKFEVNLLFGTKTAIEIKSTDRVQPKHLKGLRALKEEGLIEIYLVVSLDANNRTTDDGILLYHWQTFLDKLWEGEI